MNTNNLKIGTQLKLGFSAMLFFVIVLGVVSYKQNIELNLQTEIMYDHPTQVRKAISSLESDILNIRLGSSDLMLANTDQEKLPAIQLIEFSYNDAFRQFQVLNDKYLGPRSDIDEACKAFIIWKTAIAENTKQALSGNKGKVSEITGLGRINREEMDSKIKKIDNFAAAKTKSLYEYSEELVDTLNLRLLSMVSVILLLSLIINYVLLRNIRKPLYELTFATRRFHQGDMSARVSFKSENEFGALSDAFNSLVQSIQENITLSENTVKLSSAMLSEDEINRFFYATLNALAEHTGSQMAAAYLLSNDKKTYNHFESIGINNDVKQSFAADCFEGEFGIALTSRRVQHIKNIQGDTQFIFNTVSGNFIPREIITIPILSGEEIIAVISLAGINPYSKQALMLIDNVLVTLSARVGNILAYQKMKALSAILKEQNDELSTQQIELTAQTSELREQNTELEMQKNQLDEASKLKTIFLSNMSHELRTPLNSVIALSGVLNRRLANLIPEEEYSYLEVIERNGKNLLSLINDILDISRIEAGREETELTKFNINSLIADVAAMIHPQAQQRGIEMLQKDSDTVLTISSDARKCTHILQNLIGNAVKFTETGKVEIAAREENNNIVITITDTGIGIAKEHLPHIFDEFRQADGSTSRKFGGSGLGLAIAKKYANLLGGKISVASVQGEGSEFTLTLPILYARENRIVETLEAAYFKQIEKHIPMNPSPDSSAKTILLVEDSEPAIIQLKDILEESGYRIQAAHNGGEALGIIAVSIPDAIILDLMMQGIDGFEVLKTVREEHRTAHIPVLILTAKHITKDELKVLKRNNIHQLIQKGDVNRTELQNAVSSMVFPRIPDIEKPRREMPVFENKPLVLVVEDNPDSMLTAKALLSDNFDVIGAVDGSEGIQMAKEHLPNLILMDIALPVLDGIEAFRTIKNLPKLQHIPIIALTASAMTSDRETILAYGFDAFIAKPIDSRIFFQTLNEVLYGK